MNKTRLEKEKRKAAGARLLELERPGAGQEETAERESRQHQGRGDSEVDLPWTMSVPEAGARFYGVGVNRAYEMAKLGLMPNVWWLFWNSSPEVRKSKMSVFFDWSPLSKLA